MAKLNLSMPTWIVYQEEDGNIDAAIYLDELDQEDIYFMGHQILGFPGFTHKIDAIRWIEDCISKIRG